MVVVFPTSTDDLLTAEKREEKGRNQGLDRKAAREEVRGKGKVDTHAHETLFCDGTMTEISRSDLSLDFHG